MTTTSRSIAGLLLVGAFALGAAPARADDLVATPLPIATPDATPEATEGASTNPTPDAPLTDGSTRSNPPERGFLFAVEPSVPDPGHAVVSLGMGNVARTGEERPVGSGQVFPTLGGEVGLLSRLSLYAEGGVVVIQDGNPGQLSSPFMLDTGAHILLTDPNSRMWRLSVRPSVSYDVTGAWTGNFTGTLAWNYQSFRVATSVMGSHTFQNGSDPVDLQATLGATYALPLGFRVGVEGVVSDLEELMQPGAEGGASAFAGPTAGWAWGRVQLVAGPAFGITPGALSDPFLFRMALAVRL
jgi:hypothetical protein